MPALADVVAAGGVVVFPADTVYGLACDPSDPAAVRRLYALKGRPPEKPAAIMYFAVQPALTDVPLGPRTRAAAAALLPGCLTLLLPNPERLFALAGGGGTLGLRVPDLPRFADLSVPVLQSSANHTGGPDARTLDEVPQDIRAGADLVIDGGELPGTPSTVVDLRSYEQDGRFGIVREGIVTAAAIAAKLDG